MHFLECEQLADRSTLWIYFIPLYSHAALQLTKVNTYGLLYVWPGSNESLKPILLMAHQGTFTI